MQIALQGDMQGHDQIALMHTLSSLGRSLLSASLKVFQPRFRMTSPGKRLILGTLGGWGRQGSIQGHEEDTNNRGASVQPCQGGELLSSVQEK
jgi:hypothetical protein